MSGPAVQTADRGIGGTGIVGVITGFASVCLAGEEVALPASVTTRIDGAPAAITELRAGQVAAVEAIPAASMLQARQISVRHEVVGPVQASATGMTVAGQPVVPARAIGTGVHAAAGQWVAVSGLRRPGGLIEATRIDFVPPGRVLIHGDLLSIGGAAQIGTLSVRLPDGAMPAFGFSVTVTGRLLGTDLIADSILLDPAARNAAAYFSPDVTNFIVEGLTAVGSRSVGGNLDGMERTVSRFTRGAAGPPDALGPGSLNHGDRGGMRLPPGGEGGGRPGIAGPPGGGAPGAAPPPRR